MRDGFDVADPGELAIQGFQVAAGYLGGPTPHQWTLKQYQAQDARWRAGFYLANPAADPVAEATKAVDYWQLLGAPSGTIIFLDLETMIIPEWVNDFADEVHKRGHVTSCYGSTGNLFRNPVRSGYFPADPTGQRHLYEHPHTIATQYGATTVHPGGLTVDLDTFTDGCPLWDTRPVLLSPGPLWAQQAVADLTAAVVRAEQARAAILANAK